VSRVSLESSQRAAAVRERINGVVDPCSSAMSVPIGLADMGIVDEIRIDGGDVEVTLLPTSPGCLFLGLFEEEIEARVRALPWVGQVSVRHTDREDIWTEERMAAGARRRLAVRRG
jgi:metal-sulfur cluster biosynthetic enzyme